MITTFVCVYTEREYIFRRKEEKKEGGKEFIGEADGKALTFLLSSFLHFTSILLFG
jgi:hypothetical protein